MVFGLGCFWGAEKAFWNLPGVWVTAVGYAGGTTPNPTYEEVCSGMTGQNEVVLVVYDPKQISFDACCRPSGRPMTRPRACARAMTSARNTARRIYYTTPAQLAPSRLRAKPMGARSAPRAMAKITTEIAPAGPFYFAEDYHQHISPRTRMAIAAMAEPASPAPSALGLVGVIRRFRC